MPAEVYLMPHEAAAVSRISAQMMRRYCNRGLLVFYLVPGSTHRRISASSLREFLHINGVPVDLLDAFVKGKEKDNALVDG